MDSVLGVYNYMQMPGFMGDQIVFLEILNVLREGNGLKKIDICYIEDRGPRARNHCTAIFDYRPEAKRYLFSLHQLLGVYVNEVHHFSSSERFNDYWEANYDRCIVWPRHPKEHRWPVSKIDTDDYSVDGTGFHHIFNPLYDFYDECGYLPKMACPEDIVDKARVFMSKHSKGNVPIVLQVRKRFDCRDTSLGVWEGFLNHYRNSEFHFFILCHSYEVEFFRQFGDFENVTLTKDYLSDVFFDMACLQLAYLSVFPNGGLVPFGWFAGIPGLLFGRLLGDGHNFKMTGLKDHESSPRFAPTFREFWGVYDTELVVKEFQGYFDELRLSGYTNSNW